MNQQKATLSTEQAEMIASRLARQQVIAAGALLDIDGSVVYRAKPGWECEQIRQDPNVTNVTSAIELEEAVQDPDQTTIFIAKDASVTAELIERILKRNTLDKTLFWEA